MSEEEMSEEEMSEEEMSKEEMFGEKKCRRRNGLGKKWPGKTDPQSLILLEKIGL
jgi:hypothetical protein